MAADFFANRAANLPMKSHDKNSNRKKFVCRGNFRGIRLKNKIRFTCERRRKNYFFFLFSALGSSAFLRASISPFAGGT